MAAFSVAADAMFADLNLADDATWRPGGALTGQPVRVIRLSPSDNSEIEGGIFRRHGELIDVRASDVSAPAEGDMVDVGGETFRVMSSPQRAADGLIWRCEVARS